MTLNEISSALLSNDLEIRDVAYNYIISNYDLNFPLYFNLLEYSLKPGDIKIDPKKELDLILTESKNDRYSRYAIKYILEQLMKLIIEYNNENRKR